MADQRIAWDDLRYLEAIDRLGAVGRAARELGTSVSTVYRRIAVLDAGVGARCLAAGVGEHRLTEAGRALVAVARSTQSAIDEVAQRVRLSQSEVDGEVSLTTVDGFVPLLVGPLDELARSHPKLRVVLHVADLGPSVRRRKVDVAIGVMPRPPQGLWGRKLATVRYGVFGTERAIRGSPRRWVVTAPPLHSPLQRAWETKHATNVAVRTGSRLAIMASVRHGVGIGLLPRPLAALDASLVEVMGYGSLASLSVTPWLLTHPELRDTPRVRVLFDALYRVLGAPPRA